MVSILLVDDEPDILNAMAELVALEFPGASVTTAPDGETALEAVAANKPDLIVSDLRMPGIDGLEFLREARKRHGDQTAVLLTAFPDRRLAVEAARDGTIKRFYIKPPDVDQVLGGMHELLDPSSVKA